MTPEHRPCACGCGQAVAVRPGEGQGKVYRMACLMKKLAPAREENRRSGLFLVREEECCG